MSSRYVRDTVEAWLNDVSLAVPYYQTVNEEQNPTDNVWSSADFSSSSRDTITFCAGTSLEEGEIEVVYRGQAGVGVNPLIDALESDIALLMAMRDPTGKLILTQRSAPFEFSGGSADRWYAMSVYVDYQFYE